MLARATATNPAVNSKWNYQKHLRELTCFPAELAPHVVACNGAKANNVRQDDRVARRGGLRLPRHPIQYRDPKKWPPQSLSSAISSGEASWGTAPAPNCSRANMSARPTIARYIEESVSTNMTWNQDRVGSFSRTSVVEETRPFYVFPRAGSIDV
jgi:hypothetical protein